MASDASRHRLSNDSPQKDPVVSSLTSSTNERHSITTRGHDIDRQIPRSTPQQVPDAVKRHARPQHEVPFDDDELEADSPSRSSQNDRRRCYTDDVARRRLDVSSRRLPNPSQTSKYEIRQQPEPQYALSSRPSAPRPVPANPSIKGQDEAVIKPPGRHSQTQRSEYSRSLPTSDQLSIAAKSLPGQGLRRGSSVRDDRSQGSGQDRHLLREYQTSPPSSYPKRQLQSNELVSRMARLKTTTPAPESGIPGESAEQEPRRDSSHSLSELAHNNFDFDALVITEHLDDNGQPVRHSTKLQAMVDTGSDLNIVSKGALKKAGIDKELIETVDIPRDLEGFEGSHFKMAKRVPLTWGKAKHNGQQTRQGYFYIVKRLPDNLEMLLGRKYLRAEIEKHVAKQRARSQTRRDMQNPQEEDGELSDWVVLSTDSPR